VLVMLCTAEGAPPPSYYHAHTPCTAHTQHSLLLYLDTRLLFYLCACAPACWRAAVSLPHSWAVALAVSATNAFGTGTRRLPGALTAYSTLTTLPTTTPHPRSAFYFYTRAALRRCAVTYLDYGYDWHTHDRPSFYATRYHRPWRAL